MKIKDNMLLFHGSYAAVENIDLSMCMEGKDFGSGFYLTSSKVQAKGFIRTSLLYWNDQISGTDIYNRSAYNCRQTMQNSTYLCVQV